MSHRNLAALAAGVVLVVAACSSGGGTPAPAASACRETTDAGAVAVSIVDFGFQPSAIAAKVGQVIAFTNTGFEPHNATLDDGKCAIPTQQKGGTDGLVFAVAGTYPFHCTVHTQMTGTITIGG